jgi:hypothetical protein
MEANFTQVNTLETLTGVLVDTKPTPSIHLKSIDDVGLKWQKFTVI